MKRLIRSNKDVSDEHIVNVEVMLDFEHIFEYDIAAAKSTIQDIPYDPDWTKEQYAAILLECAEAVKQFEDIHKTVLKHIQDTYSHVYVWDNPDGTSISKYVYFAKEDKKPKTAYTFQIGVATHKVPKANRAYVKGLLEKGYQILEKMIVDSGIPRNEIKRGGNRRFIINSQHYSSPEVAKSKIIDAIDRM